MRAAVIHELGGDPVVEEFRDPPAGNDRARVLAAALNPVDLTIASGKLPFRRPAPPFVAGLEGVAQLPDGSHRYFSAPALPFGSVAEWVPLGEAETAAVPAGLDPAIAAAFGVSGLAAWTALQHTGQLKEGETVLVLGAEGQVGQVALQAARLLGAAAVVGVARDEAGRQVALGRGADAAVTLEEPDTLTERLRAAAPDGYDLIIDMIWGPAIPHVIDAAGRGARLVQVGNSAGPAATVNAPIFRDKGAHILGHASMLLTAEQRRAAYEELARRAAAGGLSVDVERMSLDEVPAAWRKVAAAVSTRKLIIAP